MIFISYFYVFKLFCGKNENVVNFSIQNLYYYPRFFKNLKKIIKC